MKVKELIECLQETDPTGELEVCLAVSPNGIIWDILSVYTSEYGNVLWIDIAPEEVNANE